MPSRSVHDTRLLSNLIKTEKDAQLSYAYLSSLLTYRSSSPARSQIETHRASRANPPLARSVVQLQSVEQGCQQC